MTLTLHNQLKLLHDLLDEQLMYKSSDINEFTQIKRLVQAIMSHETIRNSEIIHYLPEIYTYGIEGENIECDYEHINSYEDSIKEWKMAILKSSVDA